MGRQSTITAAQFKIMVQLDAERRDNKLEYTQEFVENVDALDLQVFDKIRRVEVQVKTLLRSIQTWLFFVL